MTDPLPFTGRTALVTGGTSGIGLAIATALAARGAHVLVNSEDAAACDRVAQSLIKAGGGATAMACDLSDATAVTNLAERAWNAKRRIDVLMLNAGITPGTASGDPAHEANVATVFAVNLHHMRILCETLLPRMAEAGSGSAVLTASLAGLRGNRSLGAYSLSKAAVIQLARDMAVRWGPDGIRVNAIAPGLIATGWEKAILSDKAAAARRMQMTPLRRVGQPGEVAEAALFLASDQASFITGQTLAVDGGTSITDGN